MALRIPDRMSNEKGREERVTRREDTADSHDLTVRGDRGQE